MQSSAAPSREDIAVIGMAGRFPGARSVDELWHNLRHGVEAIRSFTREELIEAGVDLAVLDEPEYVNAGAILADADLFASSFFGYSPREAELTDPQQRIFLECAWEALEAAGYDAARCPGAVGVYAGLALNTYFQNNLLTRPELRPLLGHFQMTLGNEKDFVATRVAYKLNLRGASFTVQTGCSTSLVATHLACQALLGGECDVALVGGGRIRVPLHAGYLYVEGSVPSPDGHCRAFDARAQGCVAGSGVAVVVLKRLSDALRDGDLIHAVIRGSATNNDGDDKIGFTAPSVSGQSAVISQALAMADVSADSIGYVETHGTGTSLGDPIEIAALTQAYRQHTARRGYCLIGSIKTNIGHLDAGAGVAGLIKAILAVKHGEIPQSLNFEHPNPQIDFAASPFAVATRLTKWDQTPGPRRAGVSSFGIGGTNAHVIVEQAPDRPVSPRPDVPQLLVLSAKSADALDQASVNLATRLRHEPDVHLADVAHTLQAGRSVFSHRRALVARDPTDAARLLEVRDPQRVFSGVPLAAAPPVVFLFPGGGAQYLDMGRQLYEGVPAYRASIDRSCDAAAAILGTSLRGVLLPHETTRHDASRLLEQPRISLAALFATELAMAKLLTTLGIQPAAMLGHSMGEYVAACGAGVFTPEQGLALVAKRGELFETLANGAMLSVPLSEEALTPLLGRDLSIGAVNSPNLCMASGPAHGIADLERRLSADGIEATRIHIAVAAHSAMLDPILPEFERFCRSVPFSRPRIPFVSNLTGTWITDGQATDPAYWVQHLRHTVRFAEGMNTLLSDPSRVFVEVGPGRTLSGLARQQDVKTQQAWTTMRHVKDAESDVTTFLQAVGRLWLAGVPVDWQAIHDGPRRRVSLPTYPFERKRHWIEPLAGSAPVTASVPAPGITRTAPAVPTIAEAAPKVASVPAPVVAAAGGADTAPAERAPRTHRLILALKALLHELSGVDIQALDERATFLELGFESLFLTQANAAVQKHFKVRTTFRQWFEQTPTIHALAEFLDEKLPPDARPTAAPRAVNDVPVASGASGTAGPTVPSLDSLAAQLRELAQQVDTLRADRAAPEVAPSPAAPAETPEVASASGKAIGPWKPIDGRSSPGLTARQSAHVRTLIDRYCRKTAGSKRMSEEQRSRLADPRSVSNFRQIWKEMVYQIAVTGSKGSRLWDIDGNEFIDVTMGFSVNLFGFSPSFVTEAVARQLERGIEIGVLAPVTREVADAICEMTGVDRVCFVNTGSEANMAAIRAARTVTGRDRIAVFAGAYHGIFDEVLVKPIRANGRPRSVPVAPGIPASMFEHVTVLDYGDPASVEFLRREGHDFAAVLVEPIQTRHPDLQPRDFLHALRAVTEETGTALVFDEVVTGFRLHPRGAQGWFGVDADLVSYGKLIGGGMPMAVVAGKARFMDAFDGGTWRFGDGSFPEVGVTFFGGTFVKHPLALAASAAVLERLKREGPGLHERLNRRADVFADELNTYFKTHDLPLHLEHGGSICCLTFPAADDMARLLFFHLRDRGIHIYDRPFSISTAHTDADLAAIVQAVKDSVEELQAAGFLLPVGAGAADRVAVAAPSKTRRRAEAPACAPIPRQVPLTEAQLEVWLACQFGAEASLVFNETSAVRLPGPLDVLAFTRSVAALVARHDALRTTFAPDGSHQLVAPSIALDVPLVNLTDLAPDARATRRSALLRAEADTAFDLERGPLVRVQIVQHAPDDYECVLTCHHLICDGVSFGILLNDLAAIYSAECLGQRATLPPATPFGEFAHWQAAQATLEGHADDKAFWIAQFSQAPPVLDLPADRPRPVALTYAGASESTSISSELVAGLRHIGQGTGNTLFCVLLAGFGALLRYLTRQDEVVVGVVSSGHSLMGRDGLVGHCANFLPLRIPTHATLDDSLRTTRAVLFDAFDHQNFTFGELVRTLSLRRDPGRLPLVSAMFNLDPKPQPLAFGPISTFDRGVAKRHVNFDIHLNAVEIDKGLRLDCGYLSDVYDAATVRRWLGYYTRILEAMAGDPTRAIGGLALMDPIERATLLTEWNRTASDYPRDLTVHACVEAQVDRTPNKAAVVFGNQRLSYGQLDRRANTIARLLREAGVGRGTLVGLAVERSAEMVAALLGILKTGAGYVPIDPAYPVDRMTFVLEDSGASVLLTDASVLARWRPACRAVVLEDALRGTPAAPRVDAAATADDLAYVLYTSGSTGRPKGVEIQHRALVNLLHAMRREPGLSEDDVWLAVTTMSFDIAMLEVFLPLVTGATVVVATRAMASDATLLSAEIARRRITVLQATPATWRLLIESGWSGDSRLKALCGGEAMPADVARALLPRCGELWNMYGPTETTIWSTCRRIVDDTIDIGHPIANTDVYVLDEAMGLVPSGGTGEIMIGGDGLARGYHHRPDLSAERFIPHPFRRGQRLYRTGDLGRWRSNGTLECLGRLDHQVKIRGFRIEPGEVEVALGRHAGVGACVVVAREDVPGSQQLVAYLERVGAEALVIDDLRAHVQRVLPAYMVPTSFVVLDKLPLTPNGKVDRGALPAPRRESAAGVGTGQDRPGSPLETELRQIWQRVLDVEYVDVTDSFFDLGGHSLLAIRLHGQIRDAIGVDFPLGLILQHPTVRSLANALERLRQPSEGVVSGRSLTVLHAGGSRPPLFFLHTVGGEVWSFTALARHLGEDQPVYGFQAVDSPAAPALSVVEMAAKYIAEMRQVVPDGPFLLAGHCAGAMTAFEMARQLSEAGQHVDLLAVLDYSLEEGGASGWTRRFRDAVTNLPLWVADDLSQVSLPTIAGRVKSRLRIAMGGLRARLLRLPRVEPDIRDTLGMWRFPSDHVPMLERYFDAFQRYTPEPYAGDLFLIRPRALPLFRSRQTEDLGWGRVVKGAVRVQVVRGSHETMLQEPLVEGVATLLRQEVSKVVASSAHRRGRHRIVPTEPVERQIAPVPSRPSGVLEPKGSPSPLPAFSASPLQPVLPASVAQDRRDRTRST